MRSILFIGGESFEGHVGAQVMNALRARASRCVARALGTADARELNGRFSYRRDREGLGIFDSPELRPDGKAAAHFGAGPFLERAAEEAGYRPSFAAISDFFDVDGEAGVRIAPHWEREAAAAGCLALSTTFVLSIGALRAMTAALRAAGRPVLIGGAFVGKKELERVREVPFDYCLFGEAEDRLARLLVLLGAGLVEERELDAVPGLAWRSGGELRVSSAKEEVVDFSGHACIPSSDYVRERGGLHFYESIRGCPYRCGFCDYPFLFSSGGVRLKSAETMFREWSMLRGIGVTHVCAKDSLFTYPRKRIMAFVEMMKGSGLGGELTWACYSRSRDLIDPRFVRDLSAAGCRLVHIGLESGSQVILDNMNKHVTVEDGRTAVRNCREAGIHTVGSFVLGYPGETDETARLTRDFIRGNTCDSTELFPWLPSFSSDSLVPVMQDASVRRFGIERLEDQEPVYGNFWGEEVPFAMEAWRHATMSWREALRHTFDISAEIAAGSIETEDLTYSPFRPWLRHPIRRTSFLSYSDHTRFLSGWRAATRAMMTSSTAEVPSLDWMSRSGFADGRLQDAGMRGLRA